MRNMYIWYITTLLHLGACLGASANKELPRKIIVTCNGIKGVDFVLKIPLDSIEPFSGKTFRELGQEAFKQGFPLGLVNVLRVQQAEDRPLVSKTFDMTALLRGFWSNDHDIKDNFSDTHSTRVRIETALWRSGLTKTAKDYESIPDARLREKLVRSCAARRILCYNWFFVGPNYTVLNHHDWIEFGDQLREIRKLRSRL